MYPRMEREFDRMVKKATPYLIFSPGTIRDSIADYMKSAWRAMRTNNINDFDLHCTNVNEIIAKSDGQTDDALQIDISDFDRRYLSLDQSISELKKELLELRAEVRGKKETGLVVEGVENKKRPRIEMPSELIKVIEVPSTAPILLSTAPMPIVSLIPNCPSCGNRLQHKSFKSGEHYYCFKSREGCGKNYIIGRDGKLLEKTSVAASVYMCECGLKLNCQGKREIDGELYQIYACKPESKGGCGTGYIQDKDGDLHVGRSKKALSKPKILKLSRGLGSNKSP